MNYVEIAKQIATEAGLMAKNRMNDEWSIEHKNSNTDIVTEIDRDAETLIKQRITENYPDHQFLGEEEAFLNQSNHEQTLEGIENIPYLWIVDPIDGTNNFVQGIQGLNVSIALACYGELIVGVVYDPIIDEIFWAEKNKGVYVNQEKLSVSKRDMLRKCVVGARVSANNEQRKIEINSIESVASQCLSLRILGSAAINLAYVAAGRLDAFWHYNLNVWDIAAGALIIKEAGGEITESKGDDYRLNSKAILGSNGHIHDTLLNNL